MALSRGVGEIHIADDGNPEIFRRKGERRIADRRIVARRSGTDQRKNFPGPSVEYYKAENTAGGRRLAERRTASADLRQTQQRVAPRRTGPAERRVESRRKSKRRSDDSVFTETKFLSGKDGALSVTKHGTKILPDDTADARINQPKPSFGRPTYPRREESPKPVKTGDPLIGKRHPAEQPWEPVQERVRAKVSKFLGRIREVVQEKKRDE